MSPSKTDILAAIIFVIFALVILARVLKVFLFGGTFL